MWNAIIIFFCAGLYAFGDYLKTGEYKDLGLAIILFIGGIATFNQTLDNNEQADNIERLAKLDTSLSLHIDTLITVDTSLSNQTINLVNQVSTLSKANLEIADTIRNLNTIIYGLITKVNQLSNLNISLTNNVRELTKKSIEQTALSGEFKFVFDKPVNTRSDISLKLGGNSFQKLVLGNVEPIKLEVVNKTIKFDVKIFDFNHNWLVEVHDNHWVVNPHIKSKLNYDDKGFEVIDDNDNVAFNLDIQKNNTIKMFGILYAATSFALMTNEGDDIEDISNSNELYIQKQLSNIPKLFIYTGSDYLHKRAK